MKCCLKNIYKDEEYYWNGYRWDKSIDEAVWFTNFPDEDYFNRLRKNWSGKIFLINEAGEKQNMLIWSVPIDDVVSLAQKMCNLCVEQDKLRPIPVAPKISIREWIDLAQVALDNS